MKTLNFKYFLLIPFSVLLLTALLQPQLLLAQGASESDVPQVQVARPLVQTVTHSQRFPALLEAVERVELHAQVSGYLDSIEFIEGSIVKRGDLLFRVDPRLFEAKVADAEAALSIAKSEAELAQREAERASRLFNRNAISAEEVERRNAQAMITESRVQAAEASLRLARLDLQFTTIRSPIDGRIGRALVTPGNLVTSSEVLAVIVALHQLYVRLDMAEQEFLKASSFPRQNWALQFSIDSVTQNQFYGYVAIVESEVRKGSGTVRIFGKIENTYQQLLPGMFGHAELVFGNEPSSLLINENAVRTLQQQRFVMIVNAENRVESRVVTTGSRHGDLLRIESGVSAQDQIIINSAQAYPGDLVSPLEVPMGPAALPLSLMPALSSIN